MKINKLVAALAVSFLLSCGVSTTTEQELKIYMYGTQVAPDGATGTLSPINQAYTLNSIQLQVEGGSALELFTGTPSEAKIVNRSQLIFSKDISDYEGTTFSGAALGFASPITATSSNTTDQSVDISAALTNGAIPITEAFTVAKGKGLEMTIKINWKNTVVVDETSGTETITAPSFTVTVTD